MMKGKKMLNNGSMIPTVGLGTFKLRANLDKDLVYHVLDAALDCGYRLIDTASCYRNEKDIGEALSKLYKKHGISREDLFITSKLAPKGMSYNAALSTCHQSLEDLQISYLDCYLIHWPGRAKLQPNDDKHSEYRKDVWKAFEDLNSQGLVKSIGVSNFTKDHLKELLEYAQIKPVLNQVEFQPHLYQKDLLTYCCDNDVYLQAYSSLATGQLINDTSISKIATKYSKTTSQVLLKWAVQKNVGVIPKSTNRDHIFSNYQLDDFSLLDEDVQTINDMNINTHYCWDPHTIK